MPPTTLAEDSPSLRGEAGWVVAGVVVLGILTVVDASLAGNANISGALVVAPFLVSAGARPVPVAAVGVAAFLDGLALAGQDGSGLHASIARLVVIVVGTVIAARASALRLRNQHRLVEVSVVAETAQHAIINPPPPRVGGVNVATVYRSSLRAASVGGDCYEIVDTHFGVRLILGDVRGKGMPAVRLASMVLGAFRVLAYMEADLAVVAHELDLLVGRYAAGSGDGEEFVTGVLAELSIPRLTVANCGHPPPLLIAGADGTVVPIETLVPNLPLGLGGRPSLDQVDLSAGDRVLFYTDGAIEARDQAGRFFDLRAASTALQTGGLEDGLAAVIRALTAHSGGRIDDDVALMVIEIPLEMPG